MATKLRDLTVKFGSLVDRGAGQDVQILLFKRDDEAAAVAALTDAIEGVSKVGRKMAGPRMAALKVAIEHLNQILSECSAERGEPADDDKEPDMAKKNDATVVEETPEVTPEAAPVVEKSDGGEDIAKRLADLEAQNVELRKQAETAAELAKAERDQRLNGEYIAKAAKLSALPADAATLGPILKRAAETLSAEDCAELDRILAAANEQIGKSALFREVGKSGEDSGDSAWAKIETLAKAEIEADPTLTVEKARVAVMKKHPDLKAAYYAERSAAH